jgi:hypothetical protein
MLVVMVETEQHRLLAEHLLLMLVVVAVEVREHLPALELEALVAVEMVHQMYPERLPLGQMEQ